MRSVVSGLQLLLFLVAVPDLRAVEAFICPVTQPPKPAFVPPAPFKPVQATSGGFLYGTPQLWAMVTTQWTALSANKLPFFAEGFDWKRESAPRMIVVARRLDIPQPLVWGNWVHAAGPTYGTDEGSAMITSLPRLQPGCWEITARYFPAEHHDQTLSYVVQKQ